MQEKLQIKSMKCKQSWKIRHIKDIIWSNYEKMHESVPDGNKRVYMIEIIKRVGRSSYEKY